MQAADVLFPLRRWFNGGALFWRPCLKPWRHGASCRAARSFEGLGPRLQRCGIVRRRNFSAFESTSANRACFLLPSLQEIYSSHLHDIGHASDANSLHIATKLTEIRRSCAAILIHK